MRPSTQLYTLASDHSLVCAQHSPEARVLPQDLLRTIAGGRNVELGYSLSGSTHTPADMLRNLAHRLSNRQILTENPSAPPDLLASLFYGDDQAGLAFSPITPTKFLRTLADDWHTES